MSDILLRNAFLLVQERVHNTARSKGWWSAEREFGTLIALVHSELSEALEAARAGDGPDDKVPEFSGTEAELADVLIRVLDMAQGLDLNVVDAMFAKMRYNEGREHMHGKEF